MDIETIKIITAILSLAIAIIGHEIMHGAVAYKYGDPTAKSLGRLSINPLVHIDLVGTILLPAMLFFSGAPFMFGWAKPVPVNANIVLKNGGENGMLAVSLAGIFYNTILALGFSLILSFLDQPNSSTQAFFYIFCIQMVIYNTLLAIFNLYPIPPLDGSNALIHISRKLKLYSISNFMHKISKYGMIILMLIVATPLSRIVFEPIQYVISILLKG
jgi:Zn-dependent protease